MKYLIVGLGNIGAEYKNTRHNIGFNILDALAEASNVVFETNRYANKAQMRMKGHDVILIKPTTYMNLCGKAVKYWLNKEEIDVQNLLVIVDDLSLDCGTIRIKPKGSDAGHNGLKDIAEKLNTQEYTRLKFGIGSNFNKGQQVEYVLGKWTLEENSILIERIPIAIDAINTFCLMGLGKSMNLFNKK